MLKSAVSADEAWVSLIRKVHDEGQEVRPRGLLCKEILANTSHVDMTRPIVTTRPKLGFKFMVAEAWWILTGRNDVESIESYSPHIASFSNDGIRFDGAYGPRIVDQLRFVCDTLETDLESRQAVIEIWRPNPRPSKDVPCTIAIQWMIRKEGENYFLHCFDTMRSSDAWLGIPYDWFNFSMLSAYIAITLRERCKNRHKNETNLLDDPRHNLQLGILHLTAASQHLYVDPRQDGATNIPYSLVDVQGAFAPCPRWYAPLDISEFSTAQQFINHLCKCKDREGQGHRWMLEFQNGVSGK